ncbi:hypothetical protein BGZ63DRAFT_456720 [Mariannaea sp. PMI_226]|nr:hypothetical protein BGZ63DRAFT_456720 [Mariannaea sp. PMI_226]
MSYKGEGKKEKKTKKLLAMQRIPLVMACLVVNKDEGGIDYTSTRHRLFYEKCGWTGPPLNGPPPPAKDDQRSISPLPPPHESHWRNMEDIVQLKVNMDVPNVLVKGLVILDFSDIDYLTLGLPSNCLQTANRG